MSNKKKLDVSIILVGLNSRKYILECIDSIYQAEMENYTYDIVYVDNGSTDDTVERLKKDYKKVKLLVNEKNEGYCPAANQGVEVADGRHYFFLNDDTLIIKDAIPRLIEFIDQNADCGAIGSRLFYPDMTEQWSGRMFPSLVNAILGRQSLLTKFFPNAGPVRRYLCKDQLAGKEPFVVDWVSAAAMLVSKEAYEAIGGLTNDYYYWHEAVFSDRLIKKGYKTFLHPISHIIHHEGKGSGKRPYPVQKFHILNFHEGAFRWCCEHYNLTRFNPLRGIIKLGLFSRAYLKLASAKLASGS